MQAPSWEMCVCKARAGLLHWTGCSEAIFSEALENGLVIIIHVPTEHTLTYFYLSNLVGVQCDGHVLNALPICTHLILQ